MPQDYLPHFSLSLLFSQVTSTVNQILQKELITGLAEEDCSPKPLDLNCSLETFDLN